MGTGSGFNSSYIDLSLNRDANDNYYLPYDIPSQNFSVTSIRQPGGYGIGSAIVIARPLSGGGFDPKLYLFNGDESTRIYTSLGVNDDAFDDSLGSSYNSRVNFNYGSGNNFLPVVQNFGTPKESVSFYFEYNINDLSGNTMGTAFNLGAVTNSSNFVGEFVGMSDQNDYYKFTLSVPSRVSISTYVQPQIQNSSNLTDLQLLDSSGNFLGISEGNATPLESITKVLVPGTYYARVFPEPSKVASMLANLSNGFNNVATNYQIQIDAKGVNNVTDFNADGKSDLVWRNYATGENAIWLMNGTTLSQGALTTPVADRNWSIAGTGDFNNDGKSDLIWRNGSTGKNAVWLMNGTNLSQGILLNTDVTDPNWRLGNAYPGNPNVFPGRI